MGETQLGRMQFRIMQVLWDRGRASARDVTDSLNEAEPVAHSTVQTLACASSRRRGRSGHEAEGRTFVFFAKLKEDKVKRTATRDLLERVFGGQCGKPRRPPDQGRAAVQNRARRTPADARPAAEGLNQV